VRLNLGAGSALLTGWINLDRVPMPGIDVVHDLDSGPWPFETSSANQIVAKDVFEHVADPILFMTECHRILRPSAGLFIHCPYYKGRDAFTDPTHKRFPTEHTFDYWIPGTALYNANNRAYGAVAFARQSLEISGEHIAVNLIKIV
jgi:predicted SAM-dependent methyltransferase